MALDRRGANRFSAAVWPGFVDAMTALLMVLMFVLTIFMVVQSVLRDRIDAQQDQLGALGREIADLSDTLSGSQRRADDLAGRLADQTAAARAAQAALAQARSEIDAQAEAARLAAAKREALEALTADLRRKGAQTQAALNDEQAARAAEAAAAQALQDKLADSQAELSAATLALNEQRKQAEETLTLLAAAKTARDAAQADLAAQLTESEKQAALLALARDRLNAQESQTVTQQRRVAALNEQVADLRAQLGDLKAALDISDSAQAEADTQIENLGQRLNAALLRATQAEQKRAALEAEARQKAEAEARDLARYRSEFFGRLSQILAGREGVRVVGDRFVFSSEVLFGLGEATLSDAGKAQIRNVTQMLDTIAAEIPPEIDWIIRIDGHTDNVPLSGQGRYRDNWELSQARALAVLRYMVDDLGFPARRVTAAGFADTRPVSTADTAQGRAQNRRIELKLTER